ncbi:helix-turn-helix domain-containing protein [Nocardioides sp. TF02-7]|uniref:IclR family transcriptional regulator n=1 Tax=Nocardioides sp. TF02-7 TaxID=2917724 RepID=UPI001F05588F|nr:helix-turn-helix domain-containing protein [Nocardioides sp. TF02-7]UMG91301.1 helix-turn-helix domain-containing protein [Nocardioides sp. TF02-7]
MPETDRSAGQPGTQTLARGLRALVAVAESPAGMTVQDVARTLDVHRSIAYRALQTLADHGFVRPGADGLYRAGARLAALSQAYLPELRMQALPVMRELADGIGATVALFVAEGTSAVAIEMVTPTTVGMHVAFRQGERTPLDRGAAAYALRAAQPPLPGEPEQVRLVRERGYAVSHGEIEAGLHAVAAPVRGAYPPACLNVITGTEERIDAAAPRVVEAAASLAVAAVGDIA